MASLTSRHIMIALQAWQMKESKDMEASIQISEKSLQSQTIHRKVRVFSSPSLEWVTHESMMTKSNQKRRRPQCWKWHEEGMPRTKNWRLWAVPAQGKYHIGCIQEVCGDEIAQAYLIPYHSASYYECRSPVRFGILTVNYFCITVTKIPGINNLGKKDSVWLVLLEDSIHHHHLYCCWV